LSTFDPLALMTRHVRRWGLLNPHDSVVVAVSGGPDSTALLALLCDLAKEWKLEVTAAHLDHGINREMGEVAWKQTRELAERFGVRWFGRREDVLQLQENEGASLHQVARRVRYKFFTSLASEVGAGLIATGHTADDQAETVLMRLLRGAGPLGGQRYSAKTRNLGCYHHPPPLGPPQEGVGGILHRKGASIYRGSCQRRCIVFAKPRPPRGNPPAGKGVRPRWRPSYRRFC